MNDAIDPELQPGPEQMPDQTAGLTLQEPAPTRKLPQLAPDDPLWQTAEAANKFVLAAKSASTRRAYASDWRHFAQWCAEHRLLSLPAEPATVALYLASLGATHKPATITRRLTAIGVPGLKCASG